MALTPARLIVRLHGIKSFIPESLFLSSNPHQNQTNSLNKNGRALCPAVLPTFITAAKLSQHVDKDKQANPNHIDKVPVPCRSFKAELIVMSEVPFE